jgi:hypothetical protein
MCILQESEADAKILKFCEGWRTEPALDLKSFFSKPFSVFVKPDAVKDEAAGRASVVREDLGDNGEALELAGAEAVVGHEVERG